MRILRFGLVGFALCDFRVPCIKIHGDEITKVESLQKKYQRKENESRQYRENETVYYWDKKQNREVKAKIIGFEDGMYEIDVRTMTETVGNRLRPWVWDESDDDEQEDKKLPPIQRSNGSSTDLVQVIGDDNRDDNRSRNSVSFHGPSQNHISPSRRKSSFSSFNMPPLGDIRSRAHASFAKRKSSTINFLQQVDYKFVSAHVQTLTDIFSLLFSTLGFYIMSSQFLDKKEIDPSILYADVQLARSLIESPDIVTPCLDAMHSTCREQYAYAAFFGIGSLYLAGSAVLRMCANYAPEKFCKGNTIMSKYRLNARNKVRHKVTDADDQVVAVASRWSKFTAKSSSVAKVSSIVTANHEKVKKHWMYKFFIKLKPGKELFWYKSVPILGFDLFWQCLRCFYLPEAYARTNVWQTIAQTGLMMLHVDLYLLGFYWQSVIGTVSINWAADFLYLIIRLSVNGQLSMRAVGLIDFCTLAVPFVFCVREVDDLTYYIRHATQSQPSCAVAHKKDKLRRGIFAAVTSFLFTVGFSIIIFIAVVKGIHDGCPDFHDTEVDLDSAGNGNNGDDTLLPSSLTCWAWQFNIYLSPGCSCTYLEVYAQPGNDCGGFNEDPNHALLEPIMPHIEDVSFFALYFHPHCPTIPEDFELIASWQNLRMLSLQGIDSPQLGLEFKNLPNLISVSFGNTNVESIELEVLNAWPKLESFSCRPCPLFESQDLFTTANLPRLETLELYGPSTCPHPDDIPSQVAEYRCVSRNESAVCGSLPQWFIEHFVDAARSSTRTECYEPRCSSLLRRFIDNDVDGNGLNDASEIRRGSWRMFFGLYYWDSKIYYGNYFDQAFGCLVSKIREAEPFEQNALGTSQVWSGLSAYDWTSMLTAYGNCGECETIQEAAPLDDRPLVCESVGELLPGLFNPEGFQKDCQTVENTCFPDICLQWYLPYVENDLDNDGFLSEPEYILVWYEEFLLTSYLYSRYQNYDDDRDGVISRTELMAAVFILTKLKTHHYRQRAEIFSAADVSSVPWLFPGSGLFSCWRAIDVECLEDDSSNGLKVRLGRVVAIDLGWNGRKVSTCAECFTGAYGNLRAEFDVPEACQSMNRMKDIREHEFFKQSCHTTSTVCTPQCEEWVTYFRNKDVNKDGFISQSEDPIYKDYWSCYNGIDPTCTETFISNSTSSGLEVKLRIDRAIAINLWWGGWEVTTCSECTDDFQVVAVSDGQPPECQHLPEDSRFSADGFVAEGWAQDFSNLCDEVRSTCFDSCPQVLGWVTSLDLDKDGFLTDNEAWRINEYHTCWHALNPNCISGQNSEGYTISFLQRVAYEYWWVGYNSGVSNCADCLGHGPWTEEYQVPDVCIGINFLHSPAWHAPMLNYCHTPNTECHEACSDIRDFFKSIDHDNDGFVEPADGSYFANSCTDNPLFLDVADRKCLDWVGYDCSDVDGTLHAEFGYTASDLLDVQKNCPPSCQLCDSQTSCTDVEEFTDLFGYPCSGWIGYNCEDYAQASQWGYTPDSVDDIVTNCPFSCGLCDDVDEFSVEQLIYQNHFDEAHMKCFHAIDTTCATQDPTKGLQLEIGKAVAIYQWFAADRESTCAACDEETNLWPISEGGT